MPITVKQAITEIMLLWGIENPDASASASRARAMNDLNRSVQLMWANAEKLDYFNQTTITETLTANAAGTAIKPDLGGLVIGATNATPIVVQVSEAETLTAGDAITISGVIGNLAANGAFIIGTAVDSTHFTLTTDGTTPVAGTGAYTSGGVYQRDGIDIQNILGPVRIASTGAPLNPLKTRFEAENYGPIYLGSATVPQGTPLAYYLQRQFQPDPDCLALTIFPVPIPTTNTDVKLDVVMNCPSYTYEDYCAGTIIPIPHAYGESILIPLLRHAGMSHSLFCVPTRAPLIESEYVDARKALGLSAPEVDEIQSDMAPIVNAPWNQRRDR